LVSLKEILYMDKDTFILLYKAMVRPHLEYANSVRCPYKKDKRETLQALRKYKKSHKVSYISKALATY